MSEQTYAVWYAAVGCLPDGDGPEFVGALEACEQYVASQLADEDVPAIGGEGDFEHNLYAFTIEEYGWADWYGLSPSGRLISTDDDVRCDLWIGGDR